MRRFALLLLALSALAVTSRLQADLVWTPGQGWTVQGGALAGLTLGFVLWTYTLLLPSFARPGWLPTSFIEHGRARIEARRSLPRWFYLCDLP